MTQEIFQKLIMTGCGTTNFYNAYAEWFAHQIDKLSEDYEYVVECLQNPYQHLPDEKSQKILLMINQKNGGVDPVSLNYVQQQLLLNDYQFITTGEDMMDSLINAIKSPMQANVLLEKLCLELANNNDVHTLATNFLSKTDGLDLTNAAATYREYIATILSDDRIDYKNKLSTVMQTLNLSASITDGVNAITNSEVFTMTGTHPGLLWAMETFDIDLTQLKAKLGQVLSTCFTALGTIVSGVFSAIASGANWLGFKYVTHIKEGGELFVANSFNSLHYDKTVEQCYLQLRLPTTGLGKNALAIDLHITREQLDSVYALLEDRPLVKIDNPFAAIYFGHYDGDFGDTLCIRIYPKTMSLDDFNYLGYAKRSTLSPQDMIESWTGYNGTDDVVNDIATEPSANIALCNSMIRSNAMLRVYAKVFCDIMDGASLPENVSSYYDSAMAYAPSIGSTMTTQILYESTHKLWVNGSYYTSGGAYDTNDDVYVTNIAAVNTHFKDILKYLILYLNYAEEGNFFMPYTTENGYYPQMYSLKNVDSLISGFKQTLKKVGYITLAVVVTVGVVKINRKLRYAYQHAESDYWYAINNGNVANAVKASRKSRLFANLLGMSTSTGATSVGTLLNHDNTDTIITLIKGK